MSTSFPRFVDQAFIARLEAVEVAQLLSAGAILAQRGYPVGAGARTIAGGVAAYCGPKVPISRATGLGFQGPVREEDLIALEDLYRPHQPTVTIQVSPFADETLPALLATRGYHVLDFDTVLIRPLGEDDAQTSPSSTITVRPAAPEEALAWVEQSLSGFLEMVPVIPDGSQAIYASLFGDPAATYLFASCDGAIAATGATYVHDRTAYLFATSTLTTFRGRGAQAALIEARVALAAAAGCTMAFSRTTPGSGSQRNLERAGFRAVCSRVIMRKHLA